MLYSKIDRLKALKDRIEGNEKVLQRDSYFFGRPSGTSGNYVVLNSAALLNRVYLDVSFLKQCIEKQIEMDKSELEALGVTLEK